MPNPLTTLADRVEVANGGDDNATRALAREVLLACGKGYVSPLYAWLNPLISLDAAMTLVPADHVWWLTTCNESDCVPQACVTSPPDECVDSVGEAATPALALTAAALRARAQLTDGGSSD